MSTIVVKDLQKVKLTTELRSDELKTINGGVAPLIAFGYVAAAGLTGVGVGYGLSASLDND